jgi:hypothetical protein
LNTLFTEAPCDRAGEGDHASLGGRVRQVVGRVTAKCGAGGDVDNPPVVLLLKVPDGGAAQESGGGEIDCEGVVPGGKPVLCRLGERCAHGDTRVVHQGGEGPEATLDFSP